MNAKTATAVLCALTAAILSYSSICRAFEFDPQCLDLRRQLTEAAGTVQEVEEETETDPRLLTAVLRDETYKCTSADKDYLKRQIAKDAKLVTLAGEIVAKCAQYVNPDAVRKQLTGDDAKDDSEAKQTLNAFSDLKRFLGYAKDAQGLHIKAAGICGE